MPALLGFALIGVILIITVCLVARNKRTIVTSVRKRNRNVSIEKFFLLTKEKVYKDKKKDFALDPIFSHSTPVVTSKVHKQKIFKLF